MNRAKIENLLNLAPDICHQFVSTQIRSLVGEHCVAIPPRGNP